MIVLDLDLVVPGACKSGSNLGSVWSVCPLKWLADWEGQEGLAASEGKHGDNQ